MEYHIFLIYRKLTVQDFNFQLFRILRVSPVRFDGSPSWYLTFYSNLSDCGVGYLSKISHIQMRLVFLTKSQNDRAKMVNFFVNGLFSV